MVAVFRDLTSSISHGHLYMFTPVVHTSVCEGAARSILSSVEQWLIVVESQRQVLTHRQQTLVFDDLVMRPKTICCLFPCC